MDLIGNMYPVANSEINKYVTRILEDFKDEQFNDSANNECSYTDKSRGVKLKF